MRSYCRIIGGLRVFPLISAISAGLLRARVKTAVELASGCIGGESITDRAMAFPRRAAFGPLHQSAPTISRLAEDSASTSGPTSWPACHFMDSKTPPQRHFPAAGKRNEDAPA